MFDLSWSELLLIAVVAIVFIGPKELPGALRALGRWAGKARAMAREFQNNIDDMIRDSEIDEIRKEVNKIESGELAREIEQTVDPKGEIGKALEPPDVAPLPSTPNLPADLRTATQSEPAAAAASQPPAPGAKEPGPSAKTA